MNSLKLPTIYSLLLLVCLGLLPAVTPAQTTLVRYDFTQAPFVTASVGPDAMYINPDATGQNGAVYIANNCGSTVGLDIMVPNDQGVLDQGSLGMVFGWRKFENFADFFEREDFRFYVENGFLHVQYATINLNNGNLNIRGPFNTGYLVLPDFQFHAYAFEYRAATGEAVVLVDGQTVWSNNTQAGRPLAWLTGADAIIGGIMDGTCTGSSILDFAELYIPSDPLPVEFVDFRLDAVEEGLELNWITAEEINNAGFRVERASEDGVFDEVQFVQPVSGDAQGRHHYTVTDMPEATGTFTYRIRQVDFDGQSTYSETRSAKYELPGRIQAKAYPNPARESLTIQPATGTTDIRLYNLQGTEVLRQTADREFVQLDISALPTGWYILEAGGQHLRVQKIK